MMQQLGFTVTFTAVVRLVSSEGTGRRWQLHHECFKAHPGGDTLKCNVQCIIGQQDTVTLSTYCKCAHVVKYGKMQYDYLDGALV